MKRRIFLISILLIALTCLNTVSAQIFYDSIPNKCTTVKGSKIHRSTQTQTPTEAKGTPILRIHYATIDHTQYFEVYSENNVLIQSGLAPGGCKKGTLTIQLDPDSVNSWAADGQINFIFKDITGTKAGFCMIDDGKKLCIQAVLRYGYGPCYNP